MKSLKAIGADEIMHQGSDNRQCIVGCANKQKGAQPKDVYRLIFVDDIPRRER